MRNKKAKTASVFGTVHRPIKYYTLREAKCDLHRAARTVAPPLVMPLVIYVFQKHASEVPIVWRFKGNIIRTVLYIANVLPLQWAQLTKTVHTARLGLEFVFFGLNDLSLCVCMFCFTLDS